MKGKRNYFGKSMLMIAGIVALVAILAIAGSPNAATSTIDVSQPTQVTNSNYYERGESVLEDSYGQYWLFWVRSEDFTGNYGNKEPVCRIGVLPF